MSRDHKDTQTRDELIDLVSRGQMKPEEAEAVAARKGFEPFERAPEPADFDPLTQRDWTLPMAVAWIAYRTVDAVREAWPAYCEECHYWFWQRWRSGPDGPIHEGWTLNQRHYPTMLHIELAAIVQHAEGEAAGQLMTVREARESLWTALGEDMLSATGVSRLGGGRQRIPADEWPELRAKDSDHRDELCREGGLLAYADPLVPARAVQQLWGHRKEKLVLPPMMRPEGDGYMPLYCAARWIASEGAFVDFDPEDGKVWNMAFEKLLNAIASEKVKVTGLRNGAREMVPGYRFAGCEVDYPHTEPHGDLLWSGRSYLRSYPYIDDQHWRSGFDDSLVCRHEDLVSQLMVEKGDVRTNWPFEIESQGVSTGLPGRPGKAKHLIEDEFLRRAGKGELEASLSQEAKALLNWLRREHPETPRPTIKTIQNNLRDEFRRFLRPK